MATLSAKEAARELGTDARTFRKFMRHILPEDEQPGQGNRYQIESGELKKLKKTFEDWRAPRTRKTEEPQEDSEDLLAEQDDDLDLDLGDDEPLDEELLEIEEDEL